MSEFCPICNVRGDVVAAAYVAPFILQLSGDLPTGPRETALCRCKECDFVYFAERFDDQTLATMYSGYRGEKYLSVRRSWEPWYSVAANSATAPGSKVVTERVDFLTNILNSYIDIENIANIVDYGGDEGQFFPAGYGGPKFVIEVSGKNLVDGVQSVASLADVPVKPHLVIAAHLLEHVVDPVGLVREVRSTLGEEGFFYVEVPLDRPRVRHWHSTPRYRKYLRWVSAHRRAWIAADFLAGLARNFGLALPRLGAVKESEHINYFSQQSLEALLKAGGFEILGSNVKPVTKFGGIRVGLLGALAVPV